MKVKISNYTLVGLNNTSTEAEIKRRKKQLLMIYHPDKTNNNNIAQIINNCFDEISEGRGHQEVKELEFQHTNIDQIDKLKSEISKLNNQISSFKDREEHTAHILEKLILEKEKIQTTNKNLQQMVDNKNVNLKTSGLLGKMILSAITGGIIMFNIITPVEVVKYVDKPVEVIKYVDKPVEVVKYVDKPVEVIKYVDRPVRVTTDTTTPSPKKAVIKSDWYNGYFDNGKPYIYTKVGLTQLRYECDGWLAYLSREDFGHLYYHQDFSTNKNHQNLYDPSTGYYLYIVENAEKHISKMKASTKPYTINEVSFSTNGITKQHNWLMSKCNY